MSCLSQTPPLGGLSPPQGVFQGHAAHLAEWSAKLRPKGSWGTCIPQGVTTFFYTAFTAHSDAGAEQLSWLSRGLVYFLALDLRRLPGRPLLQPGVVYGQQRR